MFYSNFFIVGKAGARKRYVCGAPVCTYPCVVQKYSFLLICTRMSSLFVKKYDGLVRAPKTYDLCKHVIILEINHEFVIGHEFSVNCSFIDR